MEMITNLFSPDHAIIGVEILTIAAILVLLGYFVYSFNLFKKD